MQNILALSCSGKGSELSRPIPAQSMCLWTQARAARGNPERQISCSFSASPAFLDTRAAGWGQHPAVCLCAHMSFWAHPARFPLVQHSVMNIKIRTRSFIAVSVTLTNRSAVNPHDGNIENNHSATPQLSAFALEELWILQCHLGGRLISCPQCKGWGCFVAAQCDTARCDSPHRVKEMLSWFN